MSIPLSPSSLASLMTSVMTLLTPSTKLSTISLTKCTTAFRTYKTSSDGSPMTQARRAPRSSTCSDAAPSMESPSPSRSQLSRRCSNLAVSFRAPQTKISSNTLARAAMNGMVLTGPGPQTTPAMNGVSMDTLQKASSTAPTSHMMIFLTDARDSVTAALILRGSLSQSVMSSWTVLMQTASTATLLSSGTMRPWPNGNSSSSRASSRMKNSL